MTKQHAVVVVQIEWPLSIVISQQAMAQYQLIFRHLFELKYVERQLNGVWQVLQATRGLFRSVAWLAPFLHTMLLPCNRRRTTSVGHVIQQNNYVTDVNCATGTGLLMAQMQQWKDNLLQRLQQPGRKRSSSVSVFDK